MSSTVRDVSNQSNIAKMKTEPDGSFKRLDASFRDVIKVGGKFEPEPDRYHFMGNQDFNRPATQGFGAIHLATHGNPHDKPTAVTVVSPRMGENGWPFANVDPYRGADQDVLYNSQHVKDLYFKADPNYGGRFTVPVLWDKKLHTIVNNESSEIIRIFNEAFNGLLSPEKAALNYYPKELQGEIDSLNSWIYPTINNGVYRSGFATSQAAYDEAVKGVFEGLDKVEKILDGKEYLVGGKLTEADIRLWVTIVRFDPVYVGHFKCNIRDIRHGYPNIHRWLRNLYWNVPAFKDSTDFDHIKTHYYWSQANVNPTRIVAVGPQPDILPL